MAKTRLKHELKKFVPGNGVIMMGPKTDGDMFLWTARVKGPDGTPYENGEFELRIKIPTDYPFNPPGVRMHTRIFHPNISTDGTICVDILQEEWSPVLTIEKVLMSIISLLNDPNPDDPLNGVAAKMYIKNPSRFRKRAAAHTKIHAKQLPALN